MYGGEAVLAGFAEVVKRLGDPKEDRECFDKDFLKSKQKFQILNKKAAIAEGRTIELLTVEKAKQLIKKMPKDKAADCNDETMEHIIYLNDKNLEELVIVTNDLIEEMEEVASYLCNMGCASMLPKSSNRNLSLSLIHI